MNNNNYKQKTDKSIKLALSLLSYTVLLITTISLSVFKIIQLFGVGNTFLIACTIIIVIVLSDVILSSDNETELIFKVSALLMISISIGTNMLAFYDSYSFYYNNRKTILLNASNAFKEFQAADAKYEDDKANIKKTIEDKYKVIDGYNKSINSLADKYVSQKVEYLKEVDKLNKDIENKRDKLASMKKPVLKDYVGEGNTASFDDDIDLLISLSRYVTGAFGNENDQFLGVLLGCIICILIEIFRINLLKSIKFQYSYSDPLKYRVEPVLESISSPVESEGATGVDNIINIDTINNIKNILTTNKGQTTIRYNINGLKTMSDNNWYIRPFYNDMFNYSRVAGFRDFKKLLQDIGIISIDGSGSHTKTRIIDIDRYNYLEHQLNTVGTISVIKDSYLSSGIN